MLEFSGIPNSHAHTYQVVRLRRSDNDTWQWDTDLPPFPYAIQSAGVASVGTVVYAVGGCDYDRKAFYCRCIVLHISAIAIVGLATCILIELHVGLQTTSILCIVNVTLVQC